MGYTDRTSAESSGSERAHLPLYHDHKPSLAGKLRYVVLKVSRRHILLLTFIVCLFIISSSSKPGLQSGWLPQNVFTCSSSRQHSKNITPPQEADRTALTNLWGELWLTFTSHGTAPPRLTVPQKSGENEPVEIVRDLVALTNAEAQATRASHAAMVKEIPQYPSGIFNGQGIVMLAGGPFSEYAATGLGMLREVGSELPVEIWFINPAEEMEGWCSELLREGIACRRLTDYIDVTTLYHPYQYKVIAMLLSSFEEVLFIDADSMPLRNPDGLFQAEPYQRTGAVLWPDYWNSTASGWTPYILGLSDAKSHMFLDSKTVESGQVLWDKQRHWRSLVLAAYYNFLGPAFYYTLISANYAGWGDKDTFPWALRALGEEYYQVPHDLSTVFQVPNAHTPPGYGIGMIQADPRNNFTNTPMFLHNNIVKWSVREFLCVECPLLWVDISKPEQERKKSFESYYTSPEQSIYDNLHENKRVFESDVLTKAGLDPEPLIWKAMEYTACRSRVWANRQVCDLARQRMTATFGFEFRPTRIASATGFGEDVCVIDPPGIGRISSVPGV